jgi:hypothetical protein
MIMIIVGSFFVSFSVCVVVQSLFRPESCIDADADADDDADDDDDVVSSCSINSRLFVVVFVVVVVVVVVVAPACRRAVLSSLIFDIEHYSMSQLRG